MRPGLIAVLLACSALPAAAQPVRQPLPPLSVEGLSSDSFDVRAFDPLGPRRAPQLEARSPAPTAAPPAGTALPATLSATPGPSAALVAPVQEARADTDTLRRPGVGRDLLSDWWTRQQFGGLR
ncbi:hypothetical protein [Roseomonas sp. USHLN139]|uniref:hypothetical protein n=1 Tax=Roseomonas sp. USHLN139 TaxID=3081298 RepID=UPI003B02A920